MATRAYSRLLEWGTSALLAALFVVLWWRQRGVAPALHEEAWSLLHAQLGFSGLWQATAQMDRSWLAYWLCLVPFGSGADALLMARTISLVCAAVVVLAVAATAGRLWGFGGALVAGGFLVANPAFVSLALSARGEMPALALLALATWLLVARLESYQDLGLGPALVYGLLVSAVVLVDLSLAPILIAHLLYAATMRPSPQGWRQLVPSWLIAAGFSALIWVNGHAERPSHAGVNWFTTAWDPAVEAAGGVSGRSLMIAAAVIIVISIVNSRGNAFFDTGLGLALIMMAAQPLATAALALSGRVPGPDQVFGATTLGMALLLGCAAGQWRGVNMHSLVVFLLVASIGILGWRGYGTTKPSWRNLDGNPPLSRDLALTTTAGDVIAVDESSGPGLTGAIALSLGDQRLWQQAREQLSSASPRVFVVGSRDPWTSRDATAAEARGDAVSTVHWVSLDKTSTPGWAQCVTVGSNDYAGAEVRHLSCS